MPPELSLHVPGSTGARPVEYRGGGLESVELRHVAWVAIAAIVAGWQAASSLGWISEIYLPSPAAIGRALWALIVSGDLWRHLSASLIRIGAGWTLGAAIGLVAGTTMGLFSVARSIGMPLISGLYPIPKIALLPLLILWLGIGETSKIATIALGVFFPTAISAFSGVDSVPRNLVRMAQSFNIPMSGIVRSVILPGALPSILSGMRISFSTALLLMVSAEMIGAQEGIGTFVLTAGNLMQTDQLMAGVLTISALGLCIGTLLSRLDKWLIRWR